MPDTSNNSAFDELMAEQLPDPHLEQPDDATASEALTTDSEHPRVPTSLACPHAGCLFIANSESHLRGHKRDAHQPRLDCQLGGTGPYYVFDRQPNGRFQCLCGKHFPHPTTLKRHLKETCKGHLTEETVVPAVPRDVDFVPHGDEIEHDPIFPRYHLCINTRLQHPICISCRCVVGPRVSSVRLHLKQPKHNGPALKAEDEAAVRSVLRRLCDPGNPLTGMKEPGPDLVVPVQGVEYVKGFKCVLCESGNSAFYCAARKVMSNHVRECHQREMAQGVTWNDAYVQTLGSVNNRRYFAILNPAVVSMASVVPVNGESLSFAIEAKRAETAVGLKGADTLKDQNMFLVKTNMLSYIHSLEDVGREKRFLEEPKELLATLGPVAKQVFDDLRQSICGAHHSLAQEVMVKDAENDLKKSLTKLEPKTVDNYAAALAQFALYLCSKHEYLDGQDSIPPEWSRLTPHVHRLRHDLDIGSDAAASMVDLVYAAFDATCNWASHEFTEPVIQFFAAVIYKPAEVFPNYRTASQILAKLLYVARMCVVIRIRRLGHATNADRLRESRILSMADLNPFRIVVNYAGLVAALADGTAYSTDVVWLDVGLTKMMIGDVTVSNIPI